jgi:hypothetical protein
MTTLQPTLNGLNRVGRLPGTVADGAPHLAYYDAHALLSFVWTGVLTDPIHVQHGGYGEPTIALIHPGPRWTGEPVLPAEVLGWFRDLCHTWAARWHGPTTTHDANSTGTPAGARGGCTHRLAHGTLACDNPQPHHPGRGCTYTSSTGCWVDDRHDDGGHA